MAKKQFQSLSDEWLHYRKAWKEKYCYEESRTAVCPRCIFYAPEHNPENGKCLLMLRFGAGGNSEVSCQGLCNRFISAAGRDINGKEIIPNVE
jgi:hypothetical protein